MKYFLPLVLTMFISIASFAQSFVKVEAEAGVKGLEWAIGNIGTDVIVYVTTNGGGGSPGSAARVITYTVTFPQPGTYNLYARIRVGAGGFNDDSYFYGNGFGVKDVANDADWTLVNGLASAGFTAGSDIVRGPGSAGSNVLKWVNMSEFNGGETPLTFNVTANNLVQTFQIGGREDGLDFDKFVFGLSNYNYTVTNLNNGEEGSTNPPPPPFNPPGPPIANGKSKFLGGIYSTPQKVNFNKYWNQVTSENGGKWGSVEATRNVMNWADLDSTYKLAKDNGFPFKMHTLIWGSQQPAWMESLSSAEQLAEIKEWYAAVAARYPAIDFIEVVNEPLHAPPDAAHSGKYINALGGSGASGWDWVLTSFRLARQYFPNSKLWLNDYSIINSTSSTNTYMTIINLLKAENLIDAVGEQGHAFTTFNTASSTLLNNLNTLAASGLPLYITELDIDGAPVQTETGDNAQLNEYKRVFPLFWEHPAIKGITVWGYRPGHWRSQQGAYLAYDNGAERPALVWLRQYVEGTVLPVTLIAFDARNANGKAMLSWRTLGEVNNDRFVIERSVNGVNYNPLKTVFAQIGNSNGSYTAVDHQPAKGINYYRLLQYDRDGQKKDLGIRTVKFDAFESSIVQVYPNPTSGAFTIRTAPSPDKNRVVIITDIIGRVIKTQSIPTTGILTMETRDLANGTYTITINDDGIRTTRKIVINKN